MRRKRKIRTTERRKRRKGDEIWLGGAKEKKDEGVKEGTLSLPCSHHRKQQQRRWQRGRGQNQRCPHQQGSGGI